MASVVLVEDERELAGLVTRALTEAGLAVETYHDDESALRRLTTPGRQDPDLIVLDIMLLKLDGLEV